MENKNTPIGVKESEFYQNNYWFNIFAGTIASLLVVLTTAFAVPLIKKLGGNDFHITLYSALPPFITMIGLIPSTIFLQSRKNFRKAILFVFLFSKIFYLLYFATLLLPTSYAPLFFVIFIAIYSLPNNLYTSGYQSWLGHIFTPKELNVANGHKNQAALVITSLIGLAFGYLLSYFSDNPITINLAFTTIYLDGINIYGLMFIGAFFISFLEFHFISSIKGVSNLQSKEKFITSFKRTFSNEHRGELKKLFIYISAILVFFIFWYFPQAVFNLNMVDRLGATEIEFAYINLIGAFTQIIFTFVWVLLARKIGTLKTLAICMITMVTNPFIHVFSPNIWWYIGLQAISALSLAGMPFLTINALLIVTSKENKAVYISIYTTVISLVMFICPFLGNEFRKSFPDFNQGIFYALMLTAVGRLVGGIIFYIYTLKQQRAD